MGSDGYIAEAADRPVMAEDWPATFSTLWRAEMIRLLRSFVTGREADLHTTGAGLLAAPLASRAAAAAEARVEHLRSALAEYFRATFLDPQPSRRCALAGMSVGTGSRRPPPSRWAAHDVPIRSARTLRSRARTDPMIAQLTGLLAAIEPDRCVIDVAGVGYLVLASTRTLAALPHPPERALVLVETQVREDAITLYGFAEAAERDWFRLLTTVQGVGAKVALGVLSVAGPADLAAIIAAGDRAGLTRAPGVGPRLADRILAELRARASAMPVAPAGLAAPARGLESDALLALAGLGFRRVEAHPIIVRAIDEAGPGATLDTIIRRSLRELAPR